MLLANQETESPHPNGGGNQDTESPHPNGGGNQDTESPHPNGGSNQETESPHPNSQLWRAMEAMQLQPGGKSIHALLDGTTKNRIAIHDLWVEVC